MIYNAGDHPLNLGASSLPNMGSALRNWFQTLTFISVSKSLGNFDVVTSETPVSFMGVRQPMTTQRIQRKPEGQRAWRWETIHALPDLVLKPDDVIVFGSTRYRVEAKRDWKEYGYVEYEIVEDYTP